MILLLAALLEQRSIRKVIYGARPALSLIRDSAGRKINACNVFDLMLASQICWSGYYYLRPSDLLAIPGGGMYPITAWPLWRRGIWASFLMGKAAKEMAEEKEMETAQKKIAQKRATGMAMAWL